MSSIAEVLSERRGDLVIAHVTGEVDASNVGWIGGRLHALLTNRSDALVVDLSGTAYIDSAGIGLLFELAEELRMRRQQLHLVIARGSAIARMAELTGLSGAVPTHAGVEAVTTDEPSSSGEPSSSA
jgi:anti-anti-sigma factor